MKYVPSQDDLYSEELILDFQNCDFLLAIVANIKRLYISISLHCVERRKRRIRVGKLAASIRPPIEKGASHALVAPSQRNVSKTQTAL